MLRREPLKLTLMREPSSHGIRGPLFRGRGCLFALLALAGCSARATPARRRSRAIVRDTGHINFVTTGGTLRNSATNTCTLNATSTQTPLGHPRRHHDSRRLPVLGRLGTAATTTPSVTLNGTTVTASRTFARTWNNGGTNYPFFGDFANVTSIVNAARQRQLHVRRPHREHRRAAQRQQHLRRRLVADRHL